MHTRNVYKLTISALLITTLAACSAPVFGGITPAATQPGTISPSAAQSSTTDLCSNPLVPIKRGATWNYTNKGVAPNSVGFSTTITDVRADGFTVETHFNDSINVNQDWACKPEGLLALSLGSGQTTLGLSFEGFTASILTSNAAGITLPSNPQTGKTWGYGLDVTGNVIQGKVTAEVTGKVATTMQVLGTESVTVPAGTFSATKIGAKTTFDMTANVSGIGIPISSSVDSSFWFAPGVGWIKSVQTGDLPGTSVNSTTELQSYTIP